jgi:site-specific DNA recombinase
VTWRRQYCWSTGRCAAGPLLPQYHCRYGAPDHHQHGHRCGHPQHQPIIAPELFDRVQRVLDSHSGAGVRTRKWAHYLRGVFFCGRCGSRMTFQRTKGNGGEYFYYGCNNARHQECDQPYVLVEELERQLERYYLRVALNEEIRQQITAKIDETMRDEQDTQARIQERVAARLKELDRQEDRYLDLLDDPAWPQAKLKSKVAAINEERQRLTRELDQIEGSIEAGRELLAQAIELLRHPQNLYRECDKAERRLLTLTIFNKLFVHTYVITGHELREPFDTLLSIQGAVDRAEPEGGVEEAEAPQGRAYQRAVALPVGWGGSSDLETLRAYQGDPGGTAPLSDASWADLSSADLLKWDLSVVGSNRGFMVGGPGFEPGASRSRTRRWAALTLPVRHPLPHPF